MFTAFIGVPRKKYPHTICVIGIKYVYNGNKENYTLFNHVRFETAGIVMT